MEANVVLRNISFTPDGSRVAYTSSEPESRHKVLFLLASLGGVPRQVLEDVDSLVSYAPAGKQFAFVRHVGSTRESKLMIANDDGSAERQLLVKQAEERLSAGASWSPDGKWIGVGTLEKILIVPVSGGLAQVLSTHPWDYIESVQ